MNVRFDYNQRTLSTSWIKKRTLHPLTSLCYQPEKILEQVYQDMMKKKSREATLTTSLLLIKPGLLQIICACVHVFLTVHRGFVLICCNYGIDYSSWSACCVSSLQKKLLLNDTRTNENWNLLNLSNKYISEHTTKSWYLDKSLYSLWDTEQQNTVSAWTL